MAITASAAAAFGLVRSPLIVLVGVLLIISHYTAVCFSHAAAVSSVIGRVSAGSFQVGCHKEPEFKAVSNQYAVTIKVLPVRQVIDFK